MADLEISLDPQFFLLNFNTVKRKLDEKYEYLVSECFPTPIT
jgi:hypothetical protein